MKNIDVFNEAISLKNYKTVTKLLNHCDRQLVDDKYIVNQFVKNKWSLKNVMKLGKPTLTKLFLESDDSIDVNNNADENGWARGWTALHQAAYENDLDHVKLLLDHGADPNSPNRDSHTPLYFSYYDQAHENLSHGKILEIMSILIDRGAKTVTTTMDNISILQIETALMDGDVETVKFVLNLDLDLRARYGTDGDTVLHYLARNDHPEVMTKVMHSRNFDVNARNNHQETPLHFASEGGTADTVEFLLSQGADANAVDANHWTPLRIATYYEDFGDRHMRCIQLLLENGADIQAVTTKSNFSTIFDLILEYRKEEDRLFMCKLMLEHLTLQEANGTKITELIQSKIDACQMRNYLNTCKELLAKKVYGSKTLLELLSCSEEKLVLYTRNADLVQIIKDFSDTLESQTVSFGNRLRKRLEKASRIAALRSSAAVVVCELMKINYDAYSFIVDSILSYLEEQDLNVLLSIAF